MAPYFRQVKSFVDVPQTDAGVDTLAFLEAAKGVVGIFDLLESKLLGVVSNDINGNIAKVRARYDAAPTLSQTLEELVKNEMAEKKSTATQGLLWLIRGLSFTCKALQATQKQRREEKLSANSERKELSDAFKGAYEVTLKPYHSFLVKPIFHTAMSACPSRAVLYTKLREDKDGGEPESEEELDRLLDEWLVALDQILAKIDAFYDANGFKKGL